MQLLISRLRQSRVIQTTCFILKYSHMTTIHIRCQKAASFWTGCMQMANTGCRFWIPMYMFQTRRMEQTQIRFTAMAMHWVCTYAKAVEMTDNILVISGPGSVSGQISCSSLPKSFGQTRWSDIIITCHTTGGGLTSLTFHPGAREVVG